MWSTISKPRNKTFFLYGNSQTVLFYSLHRERKYAKITKTTWWTCAKLNAHMHNKHAFNMPQIGTDSCIIDT